MSKVPRISKKKLPDTPKSKDGVNTSRRKNKRQNEKSTEVSSSISEIRQGKSETDVLVVPTVKKIRTKKEVIPESERSFNSKDIRDGDMFSFLSPGNGKMTYVCTVIGTQVLFERNDKHAYLRPLADMETIINYCKLKCTLMKQ